MFTKYKQLFKVGIGSWKDFILAWRIQRYEEKWKKMFESLFVDEVTIKGQTYYTIYELKTYFWGLLKFPILHSNYKGTMRHALRRREKLLIKKIKEYERKTGERFVVLRAQHDIKE